MGFLTQLVYPLFNGATACIYAPASTETEYRVPVVPTPENAIDNARKTGATGIMTVPAFILEWYRSPEHVAYLKTLKLLVRFF